ncbi:glycosyltransferase family 4 protein [Mucilaginibacter phyllosphaerae]
MKVIIANTFYYPAFDGGAEISVKLLAEGVLNEGNKVYVLTTGTANKVYRVNGVTVISVKQKNIHNSYNKSANKPKYLKVLWHLIDSCNIFYYFKVSAILNRIQPDLVHTNNIQGFSPFLWFIIKAKNIPLVHSMRDYYMLCHKCNMFNSGQNCQSLCTECKVTHNIKKSFLKYPDHFVGISNFILNKYKSFSSIPEESSSVIYNAIDARLIDDHDLPGAKLHFGYIGRVAKDKGVEYLVNELAMLTDKQKTEIKISFAGKGDPEFIEQLKIKLTGIEYNFLGVVPSQSFYKIIDVLIVPALWNEPFGRIVIESLAHAVPVCQSDRGGLKELYNPENSWIFSPEEKTLSKLLKNIIEDRQLVWEKKSKCALHLEKFSSSNYINNHLELYNKILFNKPSLNSKAGETPALLLETD